VNRDSQTNTSAVGKPKRAVFLVAAAAYALWLVFLLVLALTQPDHHRPAPTDGPSGVSPQ
jgi:hypothetical protein